MTAKNPTLAELGIDLAALRKYELDLRSGVVKTDGTPQDHAAAMDSIIGPRRAVIRPQALPAAGVAVERSFLSCPYG